MMLKSRSAVVLSLYASCVLAAPYDSYPSTGTTTTTNDNNGVLSDIGSGLLRVWDAVTCMGECRSSWGWTGNHFGGDPWGGVLKVGDPVPYVSEYAGNANARASASTTSTAATTTTAAGGFGILDVTTTANNAQASVIFSVFNVPTLSTSTRTTSATPTSTPPPPLVTTQTSTPSPTPEPQPRTTEQQQQQEPAPTSTAEQQQPSDTNNTPTVSPNTPTVSPNTGNNQGSSADQAAYLSAHNSARAQHGASPVSWSTQLEGFAQEWANNCKFQHSGGKFGRVGENLAAGTGNYGISDMVGDWMAEVTEYNPGNPVASHFTQVVWKGTSQIGCAKATCNGIFAGFGASTFYVCEYSDAGNVGGQFGANVQK